MCQIAWAGWRMAFWIGRAVQEGPDDWRMSRNWFCGSWTSSTRSWGLLPCGKARPDKCPWSPQSRGSRWNEGVVPGMTRLQWGPVVPAVPVAWEHLEVHRRWRELQPARWKHWHPMALVRILPQPVGPSRWVAGHQWPPGVAEPCLISR